MACDRLSKSCESKFLSTVHEVPSGTQVLDWTVPREWNIRDAFIKNPAGERLVDFQQLNLHVMSYSTPVQCRTALAELRPHLFTLPAHPEWVPYRTSYYRENWGFCLSEKQLAAFHEDEEYEVCIDSSLTEETSPTASICLRAKKRTKC